MNLSKTSLANNPEYFEQTIALIESSFSYAKRNHFEIDFAPLVDPSNYENLHILLEGNVVIAHIGIRLRKFGHDKFDCPVALIGGIAIKESHRGQGIFKTFFDEIINLYKDKVSFFFLWSDMDSLYKKFDFYQTGGQIQTGERIFLESDLNENIKKVKINEISKHEFKEIKDLYKENIEKKYCSFIRDEISWSLIKEVTSTDYYLYKKNNKLLGYFCIGKGQDLEHIIHEFVVTPKERVNLESMISDFRLWLPLDSNDDYNKSKILFSCFMKISNPKLFNNFINKWFDGDVNILEINENTISFEYKNENFELSFEDFLNAIFGPSYITDFKKYLRPLYISGLDSI